MQIKEIFKQAKEKKRAVLSLEIFPPKKEASIASIYQTMEEIRSLNPDFVSVTYGAGGSATENKTLALARKIKQDYGIETLHHLTCVANSEKEIQRILREMKVANIENVLALRGDLPQNCRNVSKEYTYAKDLIADIARTNDFSIGAACYPEGHIETLASYENIAHLRAKEENGADFFISQLFFENETFYTLLDDARRARVHAPISAGIMPILSRTQVEKMIFMCGASLPTKLIKLIHKYEHNAEDLRKAGLEYALEQADDLIENGVDGIHFYTMNRSEVAKSVLERYKV